MLMRGGPTAEVSALVLRISTGIAKHKSGQLVEANTVGSKSMWAKVNEVTGKQRRAMPTETSLYAAVLNAHYAATSKDLLNTVPQLKSTCTNSITWPTEYTVFNALDKLKNAATVLDGLPTWYLKLGASVFAIPLFMLFNQSLRESTVPQQFKMACITPVPKTLQATVCADLRPISITPVLSRVFEKIITRSVCSILC